MIFQAIAHEQWTSGTKGVFEVLIIGKEWNVRHTYSLNRWTMSARWLTWPVLWWIDQIHPSVIWTISMLHTFPSKYLFNYVSELPQTFWQFGYNIKKKKKKIHCSVCTYTVCVYVFSETTWAGYRVVPSWSMRPQLSSSVSTAVYATQPFYCAGDVPPKDTNWTTQRKPEVAECLISTPLVQRVWAAMVK